MIINYYTPQPDLEITDNIFRTSIDGLFYFKYKKFLDERGFFSQVLEPERIRAAGINPDFTIKQVNLAVSKERVARGLHTEGWNKLITVVQGRAFCALADVRQDSPTYKKIEYFDFLADPQSEWGEGLYISQKIGNSICAVEGPVHYLYGVDQLYHERNTADDLAVSIFDPELNIQWPFAKGEMIISKRDLQSVTLQELETKKKS